MQSSRAALARAGFPAPQFCEMKGPARRERHHHDEQQGLDPGCRAVGGDHPRFPARRKMIINTALASGLSMLVNDAGTATWSRARQWPATAGAGRGASAAGPSRWRNI